MPQATPHGAQAPGKKRGVQGRRALLILNAKARQVSACENEVITLLREAGFELVRPTASSRDEVAHAVAEQANDVDLVIAAGGDGTLGAVLQGLVGNKVPLGIMPLGTANDLAKTLHIPLDLQEAVAVIADGHTRVIDIGRVNGIYFFSETSVGLSPAISRGLTKEFKAKYGVFALLLRAIQIIRRMRRFHVQLTVDGKHFTLRSVQTTVGNSKKFGGFIENEDASIDDRRLDLYSVELTSWWHYLEALWVLITHHYDTSRCVLTKHGRRFEIKTRKPKPMEVDGELLTKTPASISIVPHAATVFVPGPQPSTK